MSPTPDKAPERDVFEIRFEPRGASVRVRPGITLAMAARAAGLPLGPGCERDFLCGFCRVSVLEGAENVSAPSEAERRVLASLHAASHERLACQVKVRGPVTISADYW